MCTTGGFSMVTLTTVGYGDMGPKTAGTRLFTCFFGIGGIGLAALSLGVFIDEVEKYRARRQAEKYTINYAYHFSGRYEDMGASASDGATPDAEEGQASLKRNAKGAACTRFSYWFTQGGTTAAVLGMTLWTAFGAMFYCAEKSWLNSVDDTCSVADAFCECEPSNAR